MNWILVLKVKSYNQYCDQWFRCTFYITLQYTAKAAIEAVLNYYDSNKIFNMHDCTQNYETTGIQKT